MIKITETEVVGWSHAIRGMRNPKDSWDKSDSVQGCSGYKIGPDDFKLASNLADAGTDHGTVLRFIQCYCDVEAPLYWWKEMDRYRVGVEKISCSTMHTIHKKELSTLDFSHDHLTWSSIKALQNTVDTLNKNRDLYLKMDDIVRNNKELSELERQDYVEARTIAWRQMIQLLPSSFNQKRTMMFSYAALRAIYHARKNHKLTEWHTFCDWIRTLPYSELITGEE